MAGVIATSRDLHQSSEQNGFNEKNELPSPKLDATTPRSTRQLLQHSPWYPEAGDDESNCSRSQRRHYSHVFNKSTVFDFIKGPESGDEDEQEENKIKGNDDAKVGAIVPVAPASPPVASPSVALPPIAAPPVTASVSAPKSEESFDEGFHRKQKRHFQDRNRSSFDI